MAAYEELLQCAEDSTLLNKARVAVVIAANAIQNEIDTTPNHVARVAWAKSVFVDPTTMARAALWSALAANKAQTKANILAATDAMIQSAVDAAVNVLA